MLRWLWSIIAFIKMLMTKLLTINHVLLPHSSKHEKEDDKFSSIDLPIFDTKDDKSSDPDDCCHYIEKESIQIFSIFITSLMITN
jgi:hypothetical protein